MLVWLGGQASKASIIQGGQKKTKLYDEENFGWGKFRTLEPNVNIYVKLFLFSRSAPNKQQLVDSGHQLNETVFSNV